MPSQHIAFPYPDGGMDEMYPSHLIDDKKFVNLENFYYNSGNKLVSRPGTEFVASFDDYIWGIGTLPNVGLAVAVQSGSILYGRSSSFAGFPAFQSIKTGVAVGNRYFAAMNSAIYSGTTVGSATTDNLKWSPSSAAAVTWPGSPPALSYVCTWNSRMWGVHRTSKTLLYFSKVGDADDWTTTGVSGAGFIDIGYSDAERITGLVAHNEQLFILKERSIWHIVTGNPNTDTSLWRVEIVTHNYGCTNHKGIVVSGNDVLIPDSAGYVSLNAALYQGDFKIANVSQPVEYFAGGSACYVPMTGQHLYVYSGRPDREILTLERFGQNIRWMKTTIHNASGTKLQPTLVASGYSPPTKYGDFEPGPFVDGAFSLIVLARQTTSGTKYDLLQYPTTYQGSDGNYDYIDGPEPSPIRKKWKTKMHTFGNLGFDKQSRNIVYAYIENERAQIVEGDLFTLSAIFNGDDANNIQSKTVTDNGTAENGPENTIVTNQNRTGLRVAVMGLGGAEGRVFKGVQFQLENNIGGYELEYGGLEMDIDTATGKPTPTPQVLA